jgi:hypothetical protein
MSSNFDRDSTIAEPGFNRFLVPPAALTVHLSVGQAYAFSIRAVDSKYYYLAPSPGKTPLSAHT